MLDNAYYNTGFQEEVSKTHEWRTAQNSLGFILKHIKPTDHILDVGCGPGSITNDLARYVPEGEIIGIETESELVNEARKLAESSGLKNVKFKEGSALSLPFDAETFDIVYAHQVLLHIKDPTTALTEMKRVVKKGGRVCCRDADLNSLLVYPKELEDPIRYFFLSKSKRSTTSITGGRELKHIALKAGFIDNEISYTCSTWCITSAENKKWFRRLYAHRISACKDKKEDLYTKLDIEDSWSSWVDKQEGVLILIHGEIICQK